MFLGLRVRVLFIYFLNFRIRRVSRVLTRQELKPDSILDIRIGQEQRVKCAQTKLGDSCCNCRVCVFLSVYVCVCVYFECVHTRSTAFSMHTFFICCAHSHTFLSCLASPHTSLSLSRSLSPFLQ